MFYSLPPAEARLPITCRTRGHLSRNQDFASRLACFLAAPDCLLANSARTLLFQTFRYLRSRQKTGRDQVLLPGYTCYSLPAAAVRAGLKVSLYDLDPSSLQPDPDDVRRRMSSRTLAVVAQHLLGVPPDMQTLLKIAREEGICLIEDSAQCLLPARDGSWPGSGADYVVYSFGRGKPLPLGQGGALVAARLEDLQAISKQAGSLSAKAGFSLLPLAVQLLSSPRLYWALERLPLGLGQSIYNPSFQTAGMPRAYQVLGLKALDCLKLLNKHRAQISGVYSAGLNGTAANARQKQAAAHVRFPVLARDQKQLGKLRAYGVRRLYPLALYDLPPLCSELASDTGCTPGARQIAAQLLTMPTHLGVSGDMAQRIMLQAQKKLGGLKGIRCNGS